MIRRIARHAQHVTPQDSLTTARGPPFGSKEATPKLSSHLPAPTTQLYLWMFFLFCSCSPATCGVVLEVLNNTNSLSPLPPGGLGEGPDCHVPKDRPGFGRLYICHFHFGPKRSWDNTAFQSLGWATGGLTTVLGICSQCPGRGRKPSILGV